MVDVSHGRLKWHAMQGQLQGNFSLFEMTIALVEVHRDPVVACNDQVGTAITIHVDRSHAIGGGVGFGQSCARLAVDQCVLFITEQHIGLVLGSSHKDFEFVVSINVNGRSPYKRVGIVIPGGPHQCNRDFLHARQLACA